MSNGERIIKVDISKANIDVEKIKKVAPQVVDFVRSKGLSPVEGQVLFAGLIESIQATRDALGDDTSCDCENCVAERNADKNQMN